MTCLAPHTFLSRRHLLLGAAATAATALLAACGGNGSATDTPKPAAPTVAPTATTGITPSPTVTPVATAAPTLAPAATASPLPPTAAATAVTTPTVIARAVPITTPPATATAPLIMFVGSEATNAPFVNEADSYPGQVIQMLLPTRYDYAKAGIPHTTAATLGSQAPKTVDPFFNPARSRNIVVMWEGQTDLYQGADVESAYASLINFCKARKAIGWEVVVLTLPPRALDNLDVVPARAHYEADRQTINLRLRANWSNYADALADIAMNPEIGPVETLKNADVYNVADLRGPDTLAIKGKSIVAKIVAATIVTRSSVPIATAIATPATSGTAAPVEPGDVIKDAAGHFTFTGPKGWVTKPDPTSPTVVQLNAENPMSEILVLESAPTEGKTLAQFAKDSLTVLKINGSFRSGTQVLQPTTLGGESAIIDDFVTAANGTLGYQVRVLCIRQNLLYTVRFGTEPPAADALQPVVKLVLDTWKFL